MPECSALYNHECVTIEGNRVPCCRFLNADKTYTVKNSTIEEYQSSPLMQEIKSIMQTDWHSGCFKCKNEESAGLKSLRNLYNLDHSFSDGIESIELSLSNKCNLTCRMCSPTYSSKWKTFLNKNKNLTNFVTGEHTTVSINDIFYNNRDLSRLKVIKYLGGEPFITPEIYSLFQLLDEKNVIQNITFMCSTNATIYPVKYIKYLQKFKFVRMHMSIDGVGVLNDYIRYGKKWDTVYKVANLWKEYQTAQQNIDLSIFSTIQAYNLHDISNLEKFSKDLGVKFRGAVLNAPSYLSINALPKSYIQKITDLNNINYLGNYNFNKEDFIKFKKFTDLFDKNSLINLKDVIPSLWEELNYEKL